MNTSYKIQSLRVNQSTVMKMKLCKHQDLQLSHVNAIQKQGSGRVMGRIVSQGHIDNNSIFTKIVYLNAELRLIFKR